MNHETVTINREYKSTVFSLLYQDKEKLPLKEAVEKAVSECIREGILKDFLLANRAEVIAMSIFEYDEEKELKLLRQAEYQAGVEDGREEGREEGLKIGEERGMRAMVTSLQTLLPDFESVYETITANETYREYTREQVRKYYMIEGKE